MNKKIFKEYINSLPKNAKVLDAGCGMGNISKYVHDIRSDLEIYGIDADNSLKNKVPDYIKFFNMSVDNLGNFEDSFFDCILCFHVLEHLHNPTRAISEFYRVLNKNGVIFAESPHWTSAITPIGFNFYDDPTHIRPYSKKSYRILFKQFSIKYISFETPVFFYLAKLYDLDKLYKKINFCLVIFLEKYLKLLGYIRQQYSL
ncbi:class I SAM-dependent methyltransferase [bacterium]|nr:class I SAM-dependent methyltransferase [bacterium]